MRRCRALGLTVAMATTPVLAGALTLDEARDLARANNPELFVSEWDVRASEARTRQAGAVRNPEVDVRLYRLGIPRGSTPADTYRSRVILGQEVELGGKRRRRVALARSERTLAGWDHAAKRQEIDARVADRFAAVLGAQRRVGALRRFVDDLEIARKKIASLVETGGMRTLEAHQASRQLGLARIDLHDAEARLRDARVALAATWGSSAPEFDSVEGDLETLPELPDLETLREVAKSGPAIARWEAEQARSDAALALARAGRAPDLRYGAGVRWQEHEPEQDYVIDFEIDLPLFDRKQGEIAEARAGQFRAQAGKLAAESAVWEQVARLHSELQRARETGLTYGRDVLPAARATFDAFRRVFESQGEFPGSLLDSRRDLARAEVRHAEALESYHRTLATLERLVGRSLR